MDISKEVNFIWNIADKLRGAYTSDKYKDVYPHGYFTQI